VLTLMMLAGIEVGAQAFANPGVRDRISEKKDRDKASEVLRLCHAS